MAAAKYVATLAIVCGCSHDQLPAPAVAVAPVPAKSVAPALIASPACLADPIGRLEAAPTLPLRPDCTATNLACRARCLDGDAPSCMARAYAIQQDPAMESEATLLFERACQLGTANGCTNYAAALWASHTSTAADLACARGVFEKACTAKENFACGMVGRMIFEAAKGPDDVTRSRDYLEQACKTVKGFPCRVLAKFLEDGKFGSYEPARIPALLLRACEGGDPDACGSPAKAAETFH